MSTRFTLRLMLLECLEAQELNGDEVYIKLNGETIWTWQTTHERLHHDLERPHMFDKIDFAGARKHGKDGWQPAPEIDPNAYIFTDLTGEATLEVWDADVLTSDDLFGRKPVRALDGGHGDISVVFRRDGGHYRVTYQVQVAD